jgi:hypothetical protein
MLRYGFGVRSLALQRGINSFLLQIKNFQSTPTYAWFFSPPLLAQYQFCQDLSPVQDCPA